MNQLYASAVGTTVLQLKKIPPLPPEYAGAVVLFAPTWASGGDELAAHLLEQRVRSELAQFGEILTVVDRRVTLQRDEVAVHFAAHEDALKVVEVRVTIEPEESSCAAEDAMIAIHALLRTL